MEPKIQIDSQLCIRCGACVGLCTARVYAQQDGQTVAARAQKCWGCGHCVAACPTDAIDHSLFPLEQCPLLPAEETATVEQLSNAFRTRRSVRVFRKKPVSGEVLQQLAQISAYAPSAGNGQPVDWLVIDDPAEIGELSRRACAFLAKQARMARNPIFRTLLALAVGPKMAHKVYQGARAYANLGKESLAGRDPLFFNAPVVLVAHVNEEDYFGRDDAMYAAYNLELAAERLGLGTCQIGYLKVALDMNRDLRQWLGLPPGRKNEVVLVLGYPQYPFRRALPRRIPEIQKHAPRV